MSQLPIIFVDGRKLPEKMPSWWIIEFSWWHLKVISEFKRLLIPKYYGIQYGSVVLFGWLIVPICLWSFVFYMLRGAAETWMTIIVAIIAGATTIFSVYSYLVSVATLGAWQHQGVVAVRERAMWRNATARLGLILETVRRASASFTSRIRFDESNK